MDRMVAAMGRSIGTTAESLLLHADGQQPADAFGLRLLRLSEVADAMALLVEIVEPRAELVRHVVPIATNDNGVFLATFADGPLCDLVTLFSTSDLDPVPRFSGFVEATRAVFGLQSELAEAGRTDDFDGEVLSLSDFPRGVFDAGRCDALLSSHAVDERSQRMLLRAAAFLVPVGDSGRLGQLSEHPEGAVREAAVEALRDWPEELAVPRLVKAATEDESKNVRIVAAVALRRRQGALAREARASVREHLGSLALYLGSDA
ncbi:MAG: HEAT repeat domain-containing protein [Myxococcales bacterium]|nr:HEAT repeat domain-containing protein [Myxococcales bacterium]